MKLDRIEIKNFRSIQHKELRLEPTCRVLVGINESGKTNLLKALSLLSEQVNPTNEDLREVHPDEPEIEQAHIWFVFRLQPEDIAQVYSSASDKVLSTNLATPMVSSSTNTYSLEEFCKIRNEGLYTVDLLTLKKGASYWSLNTGFDIDARWKRVSRSCPPTALATLSGGLSVTLANFQIVDTLEIINAPQEYLGPLEARDLNDLIGSEIMKLVTTSLPKCVYWTHTESNLLPPHVGLDQFAASPDTCIPMRQMFELAGYTNIASAIQEAKAKTHGLRNLLDRVSKKATKHIQEVWKEYKDVEIMLEPNGSNIDASIKDTYNRYALSKRSDGFKRFISFLLLISARVRTGQLANTLILIDEPDVGLHPSGARYLRDELIKISESNFVVYSTHSIFMIDRDYLGRHLIVRKKHEITAIEDASDTNSFDEEVLYNALNHSLFDALRAKNLIFEGRNDKHLFHTALKRLPSEYKNLKEPLSDVGVAHLYGVKDAGRIATMLDLASRNYLIVSDNDKPAVEAKKRFSGNAGNGQWLCYGDVLANAPEVTGEDFIKNKTILSQLKAIVNELKATREVPLPELADGNKLHSIDSWLAKAGVDAEKRKEIIQTLKARLFESLEPSHIEARYYELLKGLAAKIGMAPGTESLT